MMTIDERAQFRRDLIVSALAGICANPSARWDHAVEAADAVLAVMEGPKRAAPEWPAEPDVAPPPPNESLLYRLKRALGTSTHEDAVAAGLNSNRRYPIIGPVMIELDRSIPRVLLLTTPHGEPVFRDSDDRWTNVTEMDGPWWPHLRRELPGVCDRVERAAAARLALTAATKKEKEADARDIAFGAANKAGLFMMPDDDPTPRGLVERDASNNEDDIPF